MTAEQMRKGGEVTLQMSMTDEELKLAIQANALALAYLEGKGIGWALATTPLRLEREQLEKYLEARKRK